ncbi:CopG family transcriptional regulator [Candidatus Entotheonella palauensis]|uniref:Ribbon-helix-helix protein CopG domain-containing protein n=1 Tax=Candidatus Entotheonella gemina TaxID=1429439 RepID=W4M9U0_9BACT|nr:CopG family transcriptional regulator [Candidatus Entotheonella palauensis]ETX07149.1 MAG: hypothetical protein ETSY2_12915 [Candidatus Entotheonella gemina]
MRTTLTLDSDVATSLKRLCQERQVTMKALVNQALREGLRQLQTPAPKAPFQTDSVSVGRCLIANLDDIAEALELADDEPLR